LLKLPIAGKLLVSLLPVSASRPEITSQIEQQEQPCNRPALRANFGHCVAHYVLHHIAHPRSFRIFVAAHQGVIMKKSLIVSALAASALASVFSSLAIASRDDDNNTLVKFDGGVGSQPFAAGAGGVPIANDVKGVPPGGRPWPIGALKATVKLDGTISVNGKGMILGGGANVGRPAIPRQVAATLFCGDLAFNSAPTDLDAAGNFKISGALSAVPPNPCAAPILLIRNYAAGAPGPWFAAGIPKVAESNDD
jgi:hypothetical protein